MITHNNYRFQDQNGKDDLNDQYSPYCFVFLTNLPLIYFFSQKFAFDFCLTAGNVQPQVPQLVTLTSRTPLISAHTFIHTVLYGKMVSCSFFMFCQGSLRNSMGSEQPSGVYCELSIVRFHREYVPDMEQPREGSFYLCVKLYSGIWHGEHVQDDTFIWNTDLQNVFHRCMFFFSCKIRDITYSACHPCLPFPLGPSSWRLKMRWVTQGNEKKSVFVDWIEN